MWFGLVPWPPGCVTTKVASTWAGLTFAVGAATNLCSKIVSPETMSAEWGGATIGRTGRIVPEVIEELIGQNPIRAQSIGYIR
jgi:hypothetical protein